LEKLEAELNPVNERPVLRDGRSNEVDSSGRGNSKEGEKEKQLERERRQAIRRCLDRVSLFFRAPAGTISKGNLQLLGKSATSIPKLTYLADGLVVTYLMMGEVALPGRISPCLQS
jgi:hypothetical protein